MKATWTVLSSKSPSELCAVLNSWPIDQAKISAEPSGDEYLFHMWVRPWPGECPASSFSRKDWHWQWKMFANPSEVVKFLNSYSQYAHAGVEPIVTTATANLGPIFVVFYRTPTTLGAQEDLHVEPHSPWEHHVWGNAESALSYLNGKPGTDVVGPVGRAIVCGRSGPQGNEIHVFCCNRMPERNEELWSVEEFESPQEVADSLTGPGTYSAPDVLGQYSPPMWYPGPLLELKSVCSVQGGYLVFRPQSVVVATREELAEPLDEYCTFKSYRGFEVHVATLEQILAGDGLSGIMSYAIRVRFCLRWHYYNRGSRYAMIVGDTLDTQDPATPWKDARRQGWPDADDVEPPEYVLPTDNFKLDDVNNTVMPVGFYRGTAWEEGFRVTSLFWSDLSDKVEYLQSEYKFIGDYKLSVSIVPSQTTQEVALFVQSVKKASPVSTMAWFHSAGDLHPDLQAEATYLASAIQSTGGGIFLMVFDYSTPKNESEAVGYVAEVLSSVGSAVLLLTPHGNLRGVSLGADHRRGIPGTLVESNQLAGLIAGQSPLWIIDTCYSYDYYFEGSDDTLIEFLLASGHGPAAIMSKAEGPSPQNDEDLGHFEKRFYTVFLPLMNGTPVGRVFNEAAYGVALTGGPSLWGDPTQTAFVRQKKE